VTIDESARKRIGHYRMTDEKDRVCVALLANFTCLIVSFISVEILFFFHGMKFGLLCFWEMMTHVVT